jgi:hypothetical protein
VRQAVRPAGGFLSVLALASFGVVSIALPLTPICHDAVSLPVRWQWARTVVLLSVSPIDHNTGW